MSIQELVSIASRPGAAPRLPVPPRAAVAARSQPSFESLVWEASHHDLLTGLANRSLLLDRTAQALRRARFSGRRVALLVVGIDRFKGINDTLGHEIGDWYLRTSAERIRHAAYLGHTVARTGGDEFAVLLENLRDRDEALSIAERVLRSLGAPATFGSETMVATASAGLGVFPGDGADETALLGHADIAMAHAKGGGGDAVRFYDAAMSGRCARAFTLDQRLHGALLGNQLDLHYQPIVALDTMRVCSMEALMRWTLPDGASVPPDEFIPAAERSGMIVRLGQHALRRACGQLNAWRDAGLGTVPLAINLSPRQLAQPDIVDSVFGALDEAGLAPEAVELEITEGAAMDEGGDALPKLRRLAERGLRLAIDDFGTGHSSLSRLQKLPVHTLKIDRSFTAELQHGSGNVAIVQAIVALARALRLDTVAEGVETREQLAILRGLGCDRCQGFLISRPVSAGEARRLLRSV